MVEAPAAYPELTVRENLELVRRLRRIPRRGAVEEAVRLFGLEQYADSRARTLSLGNAQRLGLAKALLHHPRVLVLDEPVNGLDPAGVVEIRRLLVDLARESGVTVFLSSHLLSEVALVATRVGVLHRGRLARSSTPMSWTCVPARGWRSWLGTCRGRLRCCAAPVSRCTRPHPSWSSRAAAVRQPEEVATALVLAGVPPTRLAVVEEGPRVTSCGSSPPPPIPWGAHDDRWAGGRGLGRAARFDAPSCRGQRVWPSWWQGWSGASSCSSSDPPGPARSASWEPRPSSPVARRTGAATLRSWRRSSRSVATWCSG